jgi:hypothetical protein
MDVFHPTWCESGVFYHVDVLSLSISFTTEVVDELESKEPTQ